MNSKKAQESSIQVIVVIVLGTLVAAAGIYFIYIGKGGTGSVDISNAKSTCELSCFKDSDLNSLTEDDVDSSGDPCPPGTVENFCSYSFLIGGREIKCYNLVDCTITVSPKKICRVTKETCD